MASKKTAGKAAQWTTWEDIPLEEFRLRAQKAKGMAIEFARGIEELFPGLVTLTKEQRKSAPRLREGEHEMLNKVLDVVDLKPVLFESLADEDDGMNPNELETSLLRERIEKHRLLSEVIAELSGLDGQLGDSALYGAAKFRDVLYAAYRIAKTHAATDRKVNDILAPVIDFMRRNALVGAAKRQGAKESKDK